MSYKLTLSLIRRSLRDWQADVTLTVHSALPLEVKATYGAETRDLASKRAMGWAMQVLELNDEACRISKGSA